MGSKSNRYCDISVDLVFFVMDFENPVFLEDISPDQIEVEVETSETFLLDPLLDHNYNLREPRQPSHIPHNVKIRELKALFHCSKCGFATLKKASMQSHSLTHSQKETVRPQRQYMPCPSCNVKEQKFERCTQCSYYTKKKTSLKIHMRIHMKEKPYKCTECDHREQTLKQLIRHYEGHRTIEKYRCHLCSFTTSERRGGLARHLKQCMKINK